MRNLRKAVVLAKVVGILLFAMLAAFIGTKVPFPASTSSFESTPKYYWVHVNSYVYEMIDGVYQCKAFVVVSTKAVREVVISPEYCKGSSPTSYVKIPLTGAQVNGTD